MATLIPMRTGRPLEVEEYGDPRGHPAFFFHGLIGSHHQASYIAAQAREQGLRIIAPNRPGVGRSPFVRRRTPLEVVPDVEDLAAALGLGEFSVIGISGGAPYALACLYALGPRIRTATVISGMGPTRLRGALAGMDRRRRLALELGSRFPALARRECARWAGKFRADPERFLRRLVATWPEADRALFRREDVFALFLKDLHQVFTEGDGPRTFAQELELYRRYGFSPAALPRRTCVMVWHGSDDTIVPPAMAWAMSGALPRCELHLVPGGHFMAIEVSDRIIRRLTQLLGNSGSAATPGG
ncbi:MAG: alpha/beta fold hydrolase [Isosphaeraceae bacterium]